MSYVKLSIYLKVFFYTINGLFGVLFSLDVTKINVNGLSQDMCVTTSMASMPIYMITNYPLIFWFMLFGTLFWQLFGGERDPILLRLTESDMRLIKFIKVASLLRAIEVILIHTQITFLQFFWRIDFKVVEYSRLSGFLVIFLTSLVFLFYENAFAGFSFVHIGLREFLQRHLRFSRPNQDLIAYANLIE